MAEAGFRVREGGERSKKKLSASELYATLTLRLGLDPEYVLDRMEFYEIRALTDYEWMRHRDSWEQTRILAYVIAQTQTSKTLRPEDLVPLYWEKRPQEHVSAEDIERLKAKAREMSDAMRKQ